MTMTEVSESPFQTEKHLRYQANMNEYVNDSEKDVLNNETVLPNGLARIREERHIMKSDLKRSDKTSQAASRIFHHLELSRFSTESLHSYSFVTNDATMLETRQNILKRSIDFMKSKIKGWKIPVQQAFFHAPSVSSDIILPTESSKDGTVTQKPKKKRTLTDVPSLYAAASLHSPTRFVPQNQAIITTDNEGKILNANDIACLIFGYARTELCSIKALDLIASPFREKQQRALAARPQNGESNGEVVLACGKVLPIQKKSDETSAASLWLKGKYDDAGNSIFIWIFEEIIESTMTAEIDEYGTILEALGDVKDLYGYTLNELIGMHVITLLPELPVIPSKEVDGDQIMSEAENEDLLKDKLDIEQINRTKFYGSYSKNGGRFPIIGKVSLKSKLKGVDDDSSHLVYVLKIISIPTIAGVITAHGTGVIQSCNTDFVKYLFGVGSQELIGKRNINSLLPQFPRLVDVLASEHALVEGIVISENTFRHAASMLSSPPSPKPSSHVKDFSNATMSVQGPSGITAVHRDGTKFDVDIQMRVVESPDEPLHALWITYDRSVNCATNAIPEQNQIQSKAVVEEEEENFPISKFLAAGGKPPNTGAKGDSERQVITPPVLSPQQEVQPFDPNLYSAITLEKSIEDFEIIDTLGQGAYGQVKLAYNRQDPEQKRVVLKYVVKGRILVDCWTRDKVLGTVPVEIHILHTLRRIPHPNIVQMVDFFEDEEYYYIEMGLHGAGMDLFDYIELNSSMPESEIKSIFRQVARAIQHLHGNKIVHRDIKDENVILDENGNVQLIDFGSSAYIKEGKKYDTFCGTLDYAAPEVLTGKKYDGPPQDIWALGILLYTLIYKENPFYNIDEIIARDLRIPYILSEGSIDLVKRTLNRDVDLRPTIDDVLNHPWLREE
ncbi:4923_t:CDS:2 [Ambispora gerdemannii]|uniref:non-specific serine/threonine protein kinase n=1 Tax=Ambispora gerdemannii TaxID=144530 RepID=A0A9N8VQK2_9GLOM|nr:4923_t:CDS:2 [Ambispora gerdemannii]